MSARTRYGRPAGGQDAGHAVTAENLQNLFERIERARFLVVVQVRVEQLQAVLRRRAGGERGKAGGESDADESPAHGHQCLPVMAAPHVAMARIRVSETAEIREPARASMEP